MQAVTYLLIVTHTVAHEIVQPKTADEGTLLMEMERRRHRKGKSISYNNISSAEVHENGGISKRTPPLAATSLLIRTERTNKTATTDTQCGMSDYDFLNHCAGHADSAIVEDNGDCKCECRNEWESTDGKQCNFCDTRYGGNDCQVCAIGYAGKPPDVDCRQCHDRTDCDDRGAAESTADGISCECTCYNMWAHGTRKRCEECPHKFDAAENCGACALGHITYPECTECHVATHCNSHASSSTSNHDRTECLCKCIDHWSGPTCSNCHAPYGPGGSACDQCEVGYINYPTCTQCTIANHCSGPAQATSVSSNATHCHCSCKNRWTGPDCNTCPPAYTGENCNECAPNRINYPSCHLCDSNTHCNGRASTVLKASGSETCICTCQHPWQGVDCNVCPEAFTRFDNATTGISTCTAVTETSSGNTSSSASLSVAAKTVKAIAAAVAATAAAGNLPELQPAQAKPLQDSWHPHLVAASMAHMKP